VPVVGSSDSHRPDQPVGLPQTVVRADALGTRAVVRALAAGRAWLAESSGVHLTLMLTGPSGTATCGETVTAAPGDTVTVRLRVRGVPGCFATVIGPAGPVATGYADPAGVIEVEKVLPAGAARFVRAEVRRPASSTEDVPSDPTTDSAGTTMVAMANPVFVDVG
jgi:hypothetical protein